MSSHTVRRLNQAEIDAIVELSKVYTRALRLVVGEPGASQDEAVGRDQG